MSQVPIDQSANDARLGARIRSLANNIFAQLAVLAIITLLRNLLELLGPLTASRNFCCFYADYSSFLNTFTYELVLIYGGIFLVHLLLRGSREQLQRLIVTAIAFMLPLFIFVPLVNLALNYHGPELPIWPLPGLYMPMGSVLGFGLILLILPVLIKRIYFDRSWLRTLLALLGGFSIMFVWTYYLGLVLAYGSDQWWLAARQTNRMDVYSLTFVAPLLFVFPFFIRAHQNPGQRRGHCIAYGLIVAIAGLLVFTANILSAPVNLSRPLVCEQIVIPRHQHRPDEQGTSRPAVAMGQLAHRLAKELQQTPDGFSAARRRHSQARTFGLGDRIAYLRRPKGADASFAAAQRLAVGAVSPAIPGRHGWTILRRLACPKSLEVEHILVALGSPRNSPPGPLGAALRAHALLIKAKAAPEHFGRLAKEHSDGPFAIHAGRLPTWPVGSLPHFDKPLLELAPGELGGLLTSHLGLHIFRRLK